MFATLIVMTLLVGIFLGVAGTGAALVILVNRDEKKHKNPYLPSRSMPKRYDETVIDMPAPGPILKD